jgi:oligoribonuclease NrnB/cAMP/cGMP phosphodiesterase (DHH superfamily)
MKIIPLHSKILSISHNDFDGATCQIVLDNVYKNISFINTTFYYIDEILESVIYSKYDYVILTDINPSNPKLIDFSNKIVLIDHHNTALNYHNPSKLRFVTDKACAAMLTKRFVETMYNKKLYHLDNLVKYANDYDLWIHKYPKSKLLNDLMFYKYRPEKFREFFRDGRTSFTQEEQEFLLQRKKDFDKIWNELVVYDIDGVRGALILQNEFINELAEKLMKEENYEIVIIKNPKNGRTSVRHCIDGFDVGLVLKELGVGGGHKESAGMFIDDMNVLNEKIKLIVERIKRFKAIGIC